ncbi:RNA 2',3'-cyclic phosphodiesterase [Sphaerisporangium sp. NPDC051011]|uniref:RNA 2',3'-cyclic phosphodiesterase n=1 Tax=Sphaerisporangium sp. NPDC051011 TaxID=3155792 RepID=UPI0033C076CA
MVRLFVALSPCPEALAEVSAAVEPHVEQWPGLRWTAPETWHLTLAFLGEVPETALRGLRTRLARAARRYPPMTLAFQGAGAFPSARRARVVWLGVEGGGAVLSRLAASVAAAGRRAGAAYEEKKPYHPHLTLARARPREGLDVTPLTAVLKEFAGTSWRADAVHLMRSHPGPKVRYEPVGCWPLGGHD